MSKLPSKDRIGEMISWSWMAFFFIMSWLCLGIIAYGVVFQWFFRFLNFGNGYHLPIFLVMWSAFGLVYFWSRKNPEQ